MADLEYILLIGGLLCTTQGHLSYIYEEPAATKLLSLTNRMILWYSVQDKSIKINAYYQGSVVKDTKINIKTSKGHVKGQTLSASTSKPADVQA